MEESFVKGFIDVNIQTFQDTHWNLLENLTYFESLESMGGRTECMMNTRKFVENIQYMSLKINS